jgi:hypothetical protein
MTAQPEQQALTPSSTPGGPSLGRALAFGVVGLIAAGLATVAIKQIGDVFRLPKEIAALGMGAIPGAEDQAKIAAGNLVIKYKHFALWMGAGGAILGALLCLAQSLARGRAEPKSGIFGAVIGGIIGAVVGGIFGAAAGPLAVYVDVTLRNNPEPGMMTVSDTKVMMMHALTWLVLGFGIGLACALATRSRRDIAGSVLVACFAGALGGVLFPFLVGIIDPIADPTLPMPEGMFVRVLWMALPFTLIGLVIGRRKTSTAPATA